MDSRELGNERKDLCSPKYRGADKSLAQPGRKQATYRTSMSKSS